MHAQALSTARTLLAAAAFALPLALGAPAFAQTSSDKPAPDKVVAKVGGIDITEAELALADEDLGRSIRAEGEEKRAQLIQYLADLKTGAKAARDRKIDETAEYKRRLVYVVEKVLLDELLADEVKKAVTPETLKKLYDDTTKNLPPEMEVRARHILVETEDEAKKVVERLGKGEDFATLAKELSKDPGSGKDGGDLGYFAKDRMVKEFADVAFATEKGKVAAPVKSQFGWHVIKVEDSRVKPLPDFDSVKAQIEQFLTRKAQQDFIVAQRAANKVERLDAPAAEKKP